MSFIRMMLARTGLITPLPLRLCHPGILCEQLEERIVLDASVASTDQNHQDAAQQSQPVATPQEAPAAQASAQPQANAAHPSDALAGSPQHELNVVLVSNALDQIQGISDAVKDQAKVVVFDATHDGLASITQMLEQLVAESGVKIHGLAVLGHGDAGVVSLGTDQLNFVNVTSFQAQLGQLGAYLTEDAQIQFYGCDIAADGFGQALVGSIARYTGADVFASTDQTGGPQGNWTLEFHSDQTSAAQSLVDTTKLSALGLELAQPYPFPGPDNMWGKSLNHVLYFVNDDGIHGKELWRTDGIWANTWMVKDINPGVLGSDPSELTVSNGVLYFAATDGSDAAHSGRELWRSDGTAAGTALVKDIDSGNQGSNPANLTDVNGTLFFSADDGSHGTELWKSDGTSAGTVMVQDINPAGHQGSNPAFLTNVSGTLFFSADDGISGIELWKSTGTGASQVADIHLGPQGSDPAWLTNVNGTLFFAADDGTHGTELWKSDGSTTGTVKVADINQVTHGGKTDSSNPQYLTNVNGTLFFAADDGVHGTELWKSDGTSASLVKDVNVGSGDGISTNLQHPAYFVDVNGILYFSASDGNGAGSHGTELWKSDGTSAGTVMVQDINPGQQDSEPRFLYNYNGAVLFAADDGRGGNDYEFWRSDGTSGGTFILKDINAHGSSFPIYFARLNPLFFLADDGAGFKLWKSDGTAAGTVKVSDVVPSSSGTVTLPEVSGEAPANVAGKGSSTESPNDSTGTPSDVSAATVAGLSPLLLSGESGSSSQPGAGPETSHTGPDGSHKTPGSTTGGGIKGFGTASLPTAGVTDADHGLAGSTADGAAPAKGDPLVPTMVKVTVLDAGHYSIRSDMISLVVTSDMWLPPMVKWYLTAVSEGRYRPGSLAPGFERMIWDYLDYARKRQGGDQTPPNETELRLAWQWAEWRRQVIKERGSSEVLPWSYFKGLSEAIMVFYGQKDGGNVEFPAAMSTLHQNVRNLTIIPLQLPEENLPPAVQESAVK